MRICSGTIARIVYPSLTRFHTWNRCDGHQFAEDPADLVDEALNETATVAHAEAVPVGGNVERLFVPTDSSGRLCTNNVVTVRVVLEALEKEGVDVRECFCIVIHEMTAGVLATGIDHSRWDGGEGEGGKGIADHHSQQQKNARRRGTVSAGRRRGRAPRHRGP